MSLKAVVKSLTLYYQQGIGPRVSTGEAGAFLRELRDMQTRLVQHEKEIERLSKPVIQKQIARVITKTYGTALRALMDNSVDGGGAIVQLVSKVKSEAKRPAVEVEHTRYRPEAMARIIWAFEQEIERLSKPVIQKSVYRVSGYICAGGGIIGQGDTPQKAYEDYNSKMLAIKKQIPHTIQSQNPTGATSNV